MLKMMKVNDGLIFSFFFAALFQLRRKHGTDHVYLVENVVSCLAICMDRRGTLYTKVRNIVENNNKKINIIIKKNRIYILSRISISDAPSKSLAYYFFEH